MAWPELMVKGERLLALGQTLFVAIVHTEDRSHVLLPRLKIFFPCICDFEFAIVLDQFCTGYQEGPQAVLNNVGFENRKMMCPDVCS
jgi:hypothetical protein